ncbi:hypothetical protein [Acetivibrio cellulolyticus]|uniref:hypothetical protein n=1 Tax=Acetivibrio cellulolyticus TaxID=35830 RepID=UPI0001E2DE15|nr:hypothetical protein [Acetivibrio cellulolyticus]
MTIIFGNINVRLPNEKSIEKMSNMENPFEAMLSKANPYMFNGFYKNISPNLTKSYKEFTKMMQKYAKMGSGDKTQD